MPRRSSSSEKNLAYRDFTRPTRADSEIEPVFLRPVFARPHGSSIPACGKCPAKSPTAAPPRASPSPFAIACPAAENRTLHFIDAVYGEQSNLADEVEDFALLRSDGMPTYHLASCVDDADLRISHIIRGQDHLTNTYQAPADLRGPRTPAPQFAHLPLLVAPDGTKLSKRKHGPVVSVTTYRDAGFLPQAFVNFLCLLGWSPNNDREFLTLDEIRGLFTLEGVNRANAVVNFTEEEDRFGRQGRLVKRRAHSRPARR